jgi:hypothetical protein
MFNQIFSTIALFFAAAEKLARALNNLGTIGEEMSASYADEQRVLRQAKLTALNAEHKTTITATQQ